MAVDVTAPRSRRALLTAVVGSVAAAASATLVGAQAVLAGNDDGAPLIIGQLRDTAATTTLRNLNTTGTYPEAFVVTNPTNIAIRGVSVARAGVRGDSASHRGGVFSGGKAQIQLLASSAGTHPSGGGRGDLFVDSHGRLWFCKSNGNWRQLA